MKWETTVNVSGGKDAEFGNRYTIQSDFLVSGVGQLNLPRGVDVPGREDFKGKIMHSAHWDWSYHLDGKRVAIIGTVTTLSYFHLPSVHREILINLYLFRSRSHLRTSPHHTPLTLPLQEFRPPLRAQHKPNAQLPHPPHRVPNPLPLRPHLYRPPLSDPGPPSQPLPSGFHHRNLQHQPPKPIASDQLCGPGV